MRGHGTKFGRKKEEAVAALLTQRNIEEAAKTTGIAPNTLLKWIKEPEFQVAYRGARRAAFSQSIARLQQATSAAVSTLLKVMVDASTPASTKVRPEIPPSASARAAGKHLTLVGWDPQRRRIPSRWQWPHRAHCERPDTIRRRY